MLVNAQKDAAVFYFSGTGNTWWVAEELCRQLTGKGFNSRTYSIENVTAAKAASLIAESDLVGFGYPIYGSDIPQIMKDFISELHCYPGKDALVFCSQWLWSGDGAALGASVLAEKGFAVKWGEHFLMPNNVTVSVVRLPYTNDPARLAAVRQKAAGRVNRLVDHIAVGKPYRHGFNYLAFVLGCLQRIPYRRVYPGLKNHIGIDTNLCIKCDECVRLCPVGNFHDTDGEVRIKGNCILCLRCYNFCPVAAVTYMKRPHSPGRGEPYRGPIEDFDPSVLRSRD